MLDVRSGARGAWYLLLTLQLFALGRALVRMARSADAAPLCAPDPGQCHARDTGVIVPVLNEANRMRACLDALTQLSGANAIIIVDGGSHDDTLDIARAFAARDRRMRVIDAAPIPQGWNGKVWGLHIGAHELRHADWILTVDADVVLQPGTLDAMRSRAALENLDFLSLATRQRVEGSLLTMVHASMLATLVYRFGIPGADMATVGDVQANGQCFLITRAALDHIGEFEAVRHSICEDVTLARLAVDRGYRGSFVEAGDFAEAEMYDDWRSAWAGWSRSLPLRDRYFGVKGWLALTEVLLAQGLALPVALAAIRPATRGSLIARLALAVAATRIGVLAGMRRAYSVCGWTYWLSPIVDLPVATRLLLEARRDVFTWRGQQLVRGE